MHTMSRFAPATTPAYLYAPSISPISLSNVPHKISSARFAPVPLKHHHTQTERLLATGSHQGTENTVTLYQLNTDVDVMNVDQTIDQSNVLDQERLSECCGVLPLYGDGDVNDMAWINTHLCAATSQGRVHLIHIQPAEAAAVEDEDDTQSIQQHSLSLRHTWQHSTQSINALAIQSLASPMIAAAGDSTAVHLYDPHTQTILQAASHASTSSIFDLHFAGAHLLYGAGMNGKLKIWDTRQSLNKQQQAMTASHSECLLCLSVHPSRLDTVFTGSSNGVTSVWDLRSQSSPIFSSSSTSSPIWDIQCLPFDPSTVLTAAEDGNLTAYDFNRQRLDPTLVNYKADHKENGRGAESSGVKPFLLHHCTMGIRCLDVDRSSHTIIAGTDAQSLIHFQYLLS